MQDQTPSQYPRHTPPPDPRPGYCCGAVIFAILAYLIVSVTHVSRSARVAAQRATCISNAKQLGLAALQYSQDYDETLPPASLWMDRIGRYDSNTRSYHCPAVTHDPQDNRYGYAYSAWVSGARLESFDAPAQSVMVYESVDLGRSVADRCTSMPVGDQIRHVGNTVGFVDGHVKSIWPGIHLEFDLKADPVTHNRIATPPADRLTH